MATTMTRPEIKYSIGNKKNHKYLENQSIYLFLICESQSPKYITQFYTLNNYILFISLFYPNILTYIIHFQSLNKTL